jgi:hypothetical protein
MMFQKSIGSLLSRLSINSPISAPFGIHGRHAPDPRVMPVRLQGAATGIVQRHGGDAFHTRTPFARPVFGVRAAEWQPDQTALA